VVLLHPVKNGCRFGCTFTPVVVDSKKATVMPLTDSQIQNTIATKKSYKLSDGGGLFILVIPNAVRLWRLNYLFAGKHKTLSFGKYPDVNIDAARTKREDAKSLLAAGIDPGAIHKQEKTEGLAQAARQLAATRFMLDSKGGLYFYFGRRSVSLSPDETSELLAFLDTTRTVILKGSSHVPD
jgi:hypothetical protein